MRKITFAAGLAIGYVLGSKAGRERYEQIVAAVKRIRDNPTVHNAANTLRSQAEHVASASKDRLMHTSLGHKIFGNDELLDEDLDPKPEYWETAGVTTPARADHGRNGSQGF